MSLCMLQVFKYSEYIVVFHLPLECYTVKLLCSSILLLHRAFYYCKRGETMRCTDVIPWGVCSRQKHTPARLSPLPQQISTYLYLINIIPLQLCQSKKSQLFITLTLRRLVHLHCIYI